jgi:hypothetical protein
MNIISKVELTTLNQRNEDLALTVEQIKYFLNFQHSLGVVFILSIYKEYVVVYYAILPFVIFKYFSEILDQFRFPINAVFL